MAGPAGSGLEVVVLCQTAAVYGWMAVVFDNPKGLTDTTANVYILDGGMLTSSDALGCTYAQPSVTLCG